MQTGPVVAARISDILQEFHIIDKIEAVTVDNAVNKDLPIKRQFILGCFAPHCTNVNFVNKSFNDKYLLTIFYFMTKLQ